MPCNKRKPYYLPQSISWKCLLPARYLHFSFFVYNPRFFCCVLSLTILYHFSKDANYTAVVNNPCAPRGHLKVVNSQYLWGSPCVKGADGYDTSHNVTGTGNYSLCATEVNKLFNFTSCAGNKDCSFDGAYLPPTDGGTFLVSSSPRV